MSGKENKLNFLVRLEETGMLLLSFYMSLLLGYQWWLFVIFLFVPDISMVGYLFGNKSGAIVYNILHLKFFAVITGISGYLFAINELAFAGIILFGHSSLDRIFGFGLKAYKGFHYTHLGVIENKQLK
jgi:hypothetical protein